MARKRTITHRMTALAYVLRHGPADMSLADIADTLAQEFPGLDAVPHRSTIMRRLRTFREGYRTDEDAYKDASEIYNGR
jgi:hypothetical protein